MRVIKIKKKNRGHENCCGLIKFEEKLSNRFVDYIKRTTSHPLPLDFDEDRGKREARYRLS